MKSFRYLIFFILASVVYTHPAQGQDFPVQVTTHLVPPYSLKLSDYTTPGSQRLQVNVLLTDVDKPDYPVRLELVIEGQGITVRTSPSFQPDPVWLQGGIAQLLTGSDLASLFNPEHLEFYGYSRQKFIRNGRLPEGLYRFSINAYDYYKDVKVSRSNSAMAWMYLNDPPLVNLPMDEEKVKAANPQHIYFNWSPRHMGSPNSAFTTEYTLELYEVWPEGADPENVVRTTQPIFETTTSNTSYRYGVMDPMLEPGQEYAFRIRAQDTKNRDLFKNQGYSEARKFIFGDPCLIPVDIEARATGHSSFEVSWTPAFNQSYFQMRFRKADDPEANWFEHETYLTTREAEKLQPDTEYEYQVKGWCSSLESEYSEIERVKTQAYDPPAFECGGQADPVEITSQKPIEQLEPGDRITANKFTVRINEVTKNGSTFSGNGLALIPYLHFVKIGVEFEGITVNEDRQLIAGEIVTITDADSTFVANVGDLGGGSDDDNDDASGDDGSEDNGGENDFNPSDTIHTADSILDITVEDSTVIVTTEDSTYEIDVEEGEDIVVSDDSGNTYEISDGEVIDDPGSGNDDNNGEGEAPGGKGIVHFKPGGTQSYGFDSLRYDAHKGTGLYEKIVIHDQDYFMPWFSVKSGGTTTVRAEIALSDTSLNADSVKFRTQTGTPVNAQSTQAGNKKLLTLQGQGHETEQTIEAYVEVGDSAQASEIILGKMQLVSYDEVTNELVIVPLNEANAPTATTLEEKLNQIYNVSLATWNVTLEDPLDIPQEEWDVKEENGELDYGTGFLRNYSKEMRKIHNYYEDQRSVDNNKYYLFITDFPINGNLVAYMPFKKQFAFVSGEDVPTSEIPRVAAHELGHGTFRLYHTFSEKNDYPVAKGTTDNLMDYNDGKELHKYQWDFIHDPEGGLYLFQDEEEAAYVDPAYLSMESINVGNNPNETENAYTCLTPAGIPITIIDGVTSLNFTTRYSDKIADGALTGFKNNDGNYVGLYNISENKFLGYALIINPSATTPIDKVKGSDGTINFYEEEVTANNSPSTLVYLGYRKNCAIEFKTITLSEAGNKPTGKHKGEGDLKGVNELLFSTANYLKTITDEDACNLPPLNLTELDLRENTKQAVFNPYGQGGLLMMLSINGNTEYIYTNSDQEAENYYYRWNEAQNIWIDWNPQTQPELQAKDIILAVFAIWGEFFKDPHFTLDALGTVPVFGAPFDLVNGFLYTREGKYFYASLSYLAAIPFVFEGVTYVKYVCKSGGIVKAVELTVDGASAVTKIGKKFKVANIASLDDELFEVAKLIDRNKEQVEAISKLADEIPTGNQLNTALKKINGLAETKQADFISDIAKTDGRVSEAANLLKNNLSKIDEDLIEAWALLDGSPVIRLDIKNLENLKSVIKHSNYSFTADQLSELAGLINNSGSKSRLIEQLKHATKYSGDFPKVDDLLEFAKIAPVSPVQVKAGTNGKIAIIGRNMKYVKVYADELKAQGKTVEIFDVDYNTLSPEALTQWNNLRNSYAPEWIPDDIAKGTDLFIENENWIKRVDNEGYEIKNLGNPANDPYSSVFFNMEINTVQW